MPPAKPPQVVLLVPAAVQSAFVPPLVLSVQPAIGPLAGVPPHEVGSSSWQLTRQTVSLGALTPVDVTTIWMQRPVPGAPHGAFAFAVGQYGRHAPAKHVRPGTQLPVVLHPRPSAALPASTHAAAPVVTSVTSQVWLLAHPHCGASPQVPGDAGTQGPPPSAPPPPSVPALASNS